MAQNPDYSYSPDDLMQPVYCIVCRQHIPKDISNAGKGVCPECIAKAKQSKKIKTTSTSNYWNYGDDSSKVRVFVLVIVMLGLYFLGSTSKHNFDQFELEQRKFEEREQQKQFKESQTKALEQKRLLDEQEARSRELEQQWARNRALQQQKKLVERQTIDRETSSNNEWIIWHCSNRSHNNGLNFQKCRRGDKPTMCIFLTGGPETDPGEGFYRLFVENPCDWQEWRGEIPPLGRNPFTGQIQGYK
jgi:hypothetical protein